MKGTVISAFIGLANSAPVERLGLDALTQADNVVISADGQISTRPGTVLAKSISALWPYALNDLSVAWVEVEGRICLLSPDGEPVPIFVRESAAPISWTEANGEAIFGGGLDAGILQRDGGVLPLRWPSPPEPQLSATEGALPSGLYRAALSYLLPDGRETGASSIAELELPANSALRINPGAIAPGATALLYIAPANSSELQLYGRVSGPVIWNGSANDLGVDCRAAMLAPLPKDVTVIEYWRGRLYAAQPLAGGRSIVWFSRPLAPHLFKLDGDFFMVPGEIRMLAGQDQGLVVGTESALHLYTDEDGGGMREIASYGVPTGRQWAREPSGRILIWTNRGVCAALPFAELSEKASVPPGQRVHAALIHLSGQRHFVVSVEPHGEAFNPSFQLS